MMLEREDAVKHFMPTRTCRLHELQVSYTPLAPKCDTQNALGVTIRKWPSRTGINEGG